MSTPTPRTDERINGAPCTRFGILAGDSLRGALVPSEFARTLERELHESRNAERLARVQLGNERARLDDLISVNATGAARLAHATAQLATEREKVRALRLACERIANQWDADHDTNPIGAGGLMYSRASFALAATEDAQ
jgi:hypothetical protein